MGLATLSQEVFLAGMIEIWGNMLFWAFLATTAIYVVFGVTCAVCLRVKKGVSVALPFVYLGFGELKVLCSDAIACAFVAAIYVTIGWRMSSLAAFGWGIGLSVAAVITSALISLVPVYAFL